MTHTKGEWVDKQTHNDLNITHIEPSCGCEWWVTVYSVDEDTLEDHRARCRLIASAHDLLKVLEWIVSNGEFAHRNNILQVAKDAISKAKGE